VITDYWDHHQEGIDAVRLAHVLGIGGATPTSKARTVITSLLNKKLIEAAGTRQADGETGGQPAKLFRPIPFVRDRSRNLPLIPLEPLIENAAPSEPETKRGRRGKGASFEEGVQSPPYLMEDGDSE